MTSMGRPMLIWHDRNGWGTAAPVGWTRSVPRMPTGMSGAPVRSARRAGTGVAPVEAAVARAGALGVDAEQLSLVQDPAAVSSAR